MEWRAVTAELLVAARLLGQIFCVLKKIKKTVDISFLMVYNAECTDEVHKNKINERP